MRLEFVFDYPSPYAYLATTITKIVNGHPNARLDELLPWAYPTATAFRAVA